MSTTPTRPETTEAQPPAPSLGTPRWIPILFVILFLFGGYMVYANYHSGQVFNKQVAQTNSRIAQLDSSLQAQADDLKAELDLTSQKLGITQAQLEEARRTSAALRREQALSSKKLQEQIGQVQQQTQASVGQLSTELGGTQSDLATTKASLNDTRTKLESTVGDMGVMSGLIAHNQTQLNQLIHLGQRDYYKFDIYRAKHPDRVGPIMIQVSHVDVKHWRYNMYVTVEDKRIEKKDKTLYEPVQFYTAEAPAPLEIVVFQIKKNELVGYLSTPKDQAKQAATTTDPGGS